MKYRFKVWHGIGGTWHWATECNAGIEWCTLGAGERFAEHAAQAEAIDNINAKKAAVAAEKRARAAEWRDAS